MLLNILYNETIYGLNINILFLSKMGTFIFTFININIDWFIYKNYLWYDYNIPLSESVSDSTTSAGATRSASNKTLRGVVIILPWMRKSQGYCFPVMEIRKCKLYIHENVN